MRTELISISTETVPLDGAFHEPDGAAASGAVMLIHGNSMNFYVGAPRFLPPFLCRLGLASLAFNCRGHDILGIRDSLAAEGAAYQLVRETLADIDRAAAWLAGRGFAHPIIIGHSNGALMGARHVLERPRTPALVLLSAHAGGNDTIPALCRAGLFAGDRLDEIAGRARDFVAAGRGRELLLLPHWWYAISAESLIDRLTAMPELLALAPRIACPVLYVVGDREPPAAYPADEYRCRAGGPCEVVKIADCDHFYVGREREVAETVISWLAPTLATGANYRLAPNSGA